MALERAQPQMSRQLELPLTRSEEARAGCPGAVHSGTSGLLEEVLERTNLQAALKRVKQNKGSAGIDGMGVEELPDFLRGNWVRIRAEILAGRYQPQPVRRHLIPKKGGGVRELGIPCVLDRLIQQAILQVLQPRIDPTFSEHSYGFRPGRRAHDAIRAATRHIESGREWVVDVDLEKFFDRVNHDVLMDRLEKRVPDRRVLALIRRYLMAGIMDGGITMERYEGTPQGGPLSPLLANVLLDEVDRALEERGHAFARYADDCNVYVRSQRAGERVMGLLRRLYGRLRLRINTSKSAVGHVTERGFLGFQASRPKDGWRWKVTAKALESFKDRVREITARTGGRSIAVVVSELRSYMNGWKPYYGLAKMPTMFGDLDGWIRRRLRMLHLKQWRHPRRVYLKLVARGVSAQKARFVASFCQSWWSAANQDATRIALPNRYFDELGVPRLAS